MNQQWLQLKEVPKYIKKRTSLTVSKYVVYHWIIKGRKSDSGQIVLLKATKKLGTWLTTEKWIDKFIEGVSQ